MVLLECQYLADVWFWSAGTHGLQLPDQICLVIREDGQTYRFPEETHTVKLHLQ